MSIPVVDIKPLFGADVAAKRAVASQMGSAFRTVGFAYVVGHGVDGQLIDAVFDASSQFFSAPLALKESVAFQGAHGNRGYIGIGKESLDPGEEPDFKEAFNIGLELADDDPDVLAGSPFRSVNHWPKIAGFREIMLSYFDAMSALAALIHTAIAMDLGLDPNFFVEKFRKPLTTLRLLHYPPRTAETGAVQKGAGEHTDYGNITLLAADAVDGLMVRERNGAWIAAPSTPGAFICNIGDCLMRWTNDVYTSTPHKVETPAGRERYSAAFFVDPDPDAIVSCIASCVGPEQPPKYAPVTSGEHLRSRLEPTYAHSARATTPG